MALKAKCSRLHGHRQAVAHCIRSSVIAQRSYQRSGRWPGALQVSMVASTTTLPAETSEIQSTTAASTTALPQPQADSLHSKFDWLSYWYPVQVSADTDPSRPHAIELLGKQLVLWRDGQGKWRCMEDACPHRLAPLSEGRLESDGTLQCSYHGWRFNGQGRCTEIPQAIDEKAKAVACSSSRSCVTSYPVREDCGLIWVWPTAGAAAEAVAEAAPTPLPKGQIAHWREEEPRGWYRRDLPYSWDVLIENLTDPSHLPFSHHNLSPLLKRSEGEAPMPFTPIEIPGGDSPEDAAARPDYVLEHKAPLAAFEFPSAMSPAGRVAFTPPLNVTYEYNFGPVNKMQNDLIAVPAGPGRSVAYTIGRSNIPKVQTADLVKALFTNPKALPMLFNRYLYQMQPKHVMHRHMNKLFDQDSLFLNMQDRQLALRGKSSWTRDYYMPTQADGLVIVGRKWVDFALQLSLQGHKLAAEKTTANKTPTAADAFSLSPNEASLTRPAGPQETGDRYNQHTKHCTACQQALQGLERRLQRVQAAAAGLAAAVVGVVAGVVAPGLYAAVAQNSTAAAAGAVVPGVAIAAVLGLAAVLAKRVATATADSIAEFKYVEFSHADNH